MRIHSSSFQACIARDGVGGAIALISYEDVDMQDVSIVSCSAVDGGGVFFGTTIQSKLVRVNFTSNSATVNGGALWIGQLNTINMISVTMNNHKALSGASVYVSDYGLDMNMIDCLIVDSHAEGDGGAMAVLASVTKLNIKNVIAKS